MCLQTIGPGLGGQGRVSQQSIPSSTQLRMIVQQIQMAVQAGHLNPQILNQPLAPQTLLLLNQLLNQIKQLQHLQLNSQHPSSSLIKPNTTTALQVSVQITKTKQQIANLQNQIVAQQALYVKQQQILQQHLQQQQQQQQQQQTAVAVAAADFFKPSAIDLNLIQGGLQDVSLKEAVPTTPTSQSRLSQWKQLPALDKEIDVPVSATGAGGGDFSRAPGTVTKSVPPSSHSSAANLNAIFGQTDSTWSLSRSQVSSGNDM